MKIINHLKQIFIICAFLFFLGVNVLAAEPTAFNHMNGSTILAPDGSVWSGFYIWPHQAFMQIGDGVDTLSDMKSMIRQGKMFTAWDDGGRVFGKYGDPDARYFVNKNTLYMAPVMPELDQVKSFVGIYGSYYALRENGDLYAWGESDLLEDRLFQAEPDDLPPNVYDSGYEVPEPRKILRLPPLQDIKIGGAYSVTVLGKDGTVWQWGETILENYRKVLCTVVPQKVMDDVKDIQVGSYFTAAIKKDNTLWVWGNFANYYHRNLNTPEDYLKEPKFVLNNVKQVVSGPYDEGGLLITRLDGSLWALRDFRFNNIIFSGPEQYRRYKEPTKIYDASDCLTGDKDYPGAECLRVDECRILASNVCYRESNGAFYVPLPNKHGDFAMTKVLEPDENGKYYAIPDVLQVNEDWWILETGRP